MKKISLLFMTVSLLGIISCHNESWDFPDFAYKTVYFPYQTPVRTLVLGDSEYNNENQDDNNLNFVISAHMGGVYENKDNQTVNFVIDPNLVKNLKTATGEILEVLPSSYYTINPASQIVIPKGELYAGFEVQLTDQFLNDPLAFKTHYVIPYIITTSSLDTILSGKPLVANPDRRIKSDWIIVPKDYTLFGIKYVNAYHGKYLTRGRSVRKDAITSTPIDTVIYRPRYVENSEIWSLKTTARNKVNVTGTVKAKVGSPGALNMDLVFDNSGNCVITNNPASAFVITGTGKLVKEGDEWGGKKRNAIYLSYQINVPPTKHIVNDTLVIRDRDVRFETFDPVVF